MFANNILPVCSVCCLFSNNISPSLSLMHLLPSFVRDFPGIRLSLDHAMTLTYVGLDMPSRTAQYVYKTLLFAAVNCFLTILCNCLIDMMILVYGFLCRSFYSYLKDYAPLFKSDIILNPKLAEFAMSYSKRTRVLI